MKCIKSETELLFNHYQSAFPRQNSIESSKDNSSKQRIRYESNENRGNGVNSQLKIRLKARPLLDILRVNEGVGELCDKMR